MYYLLSASASLGMGYGPGCNFIRFRGQLDIITRVTGKSTMENGDDCDQRAEEQLDYVTFNPTAAWTISAANSDHAPWPE